MASLQQHARDCEEFLGDECVDVNRWVDEFFATLGPAHRKVRHHREGISEARSLFGEKGARAATVHILRDCRHIPSRKDYDNGAVDALGLKKEWPASAYVKYSEEDFKAVVKNQLFGPTGLFLWSFVNEQILAQFLLSSTKLTDSDVEALTPRWREATAIRANLPPLVTAMGRIRTEVSAEADSYINHFMNSPAGQQLRVNLPDMTFAYVPIDSLITPLVFIDGEYLEGIRPELQSDRDLDVIKFCFPSVSSVQIRGISEPTQQSVTFLSPLKSLTVGPVSVRQVPEGTEVRFIVAVNLSNVHVSLMGDRLLLRNGVHRAYLLKTLGFTEIPCILTKDNFLPGLTASAYPSFVPNVLLAPRPPLLSDYADPNLSLEAPLQRTNKVIRIASEQSILPVD